MLICAGPRGALSGRGICQGGNEGDPRRSFNDDAVEVPAFLFTVIPGCEMLRARRKESPGKEVVSATHPF